MLSVLSYLGVPTGDAAIIMNLLNSISPCLRVSVVILALLALAGCDAERRKSDAELGLNPQQAEGRKLYDNYCDRCHEPYSSHGKKGPSLKGVFKQQYLSLSGLPANDNRVGEIVKYGRSKMEGFGQVMSDQQIKDLLAYLHTL
jgi:mono/diheme cytochrome c family protein